MEFKDLTVSIFFFNTFFDCLSTRMRCDFFFPKRNVHALCWGGGCIRQARPVVETKRELEPESQKALGWEEMGKEESGSLGEEHMVPGGRCKASRR